MTTTIDTARDLGRDANAANRVCSPALDATMMALYFAQPDHLKADTLRAWIDGWHAENLARAWAATQWEKD